MESGESHTHSYFKRAAYIIFSAIKCDKEKCIKFCKIMFSHTWCASINAYIAPAGHHYNVSVSKS